MISDADLPAVERLLGAEADAVLAAAVAHRRGRIQAATPTFVDYVPGRRLGVRYLARVEWPDGTREETLAASLGRGEAPAGATMVDAAGSSVAVWHYPVDPWLPGLEQAWDVNFVRSLLYELGLPAHEITLA
ncbi:MAG: hypothetical protein QOJ79_1916, partial [Actinomycetota bacterium]|nr:hypothetical protein [Actinomycetota bacterium]